MQRLGQGSGEMLPIRRIGSSEMTPTPVDLPDMSVDEAFSLELVRRGTIAFVDVELPHDAAIHGGMRAYVKSHLIGRNPVCFDEEGFLRTGFAVEDHSDETMTGVRLFAVQMQKLFRAESAYFYPVVLPELPHEDI